MKSSSQNKFFASALKRAKSLIENRKQLQLLLKQGLDKLSATNGTESLAKLRDNAMLLSRMAKAYANGTYQNLPKSSIIKIVGAIVYFVAVIDLVPDFVLGLGLLDDAGVIAMVVSSLRRDIRDFQEWEQSQASSDTTQALA